MKKQKLGVGKVLDSLIKHSGMTLKEVASKADVPYSSLCHLRQNRSPRNIDHVLRLSKLFKVSFHYLLYGKSDPFEARSDDTEINGVFEVIIKRHRGGQS